MNFPTVKSFRSGWMPIRDKSSFRPSPVVPTDPSVTGGSPLSPQVTNNGNYLDERVTWHMVVFPQPFGVQAEYTHREGASTE